MSQQSQSTAFSIPEDVLKNSKIKYLDITNKLNDYNEIYNLNQHLLDSNSKELDKLVKMNNQIRTKLMKAKQSYLLIDYGINEYDMYNNLLGFTIVLAAITVAIVAVTKKENTQKLIWICVGIALFYLIVLMIVLSKNVKRRTYAWSQWYWDPANKNN